jgi:hypothetical protein
MLTLMAVAVLAAKLLPAILLALAVGMAVQDTAPTGGGYLGSLAIATGGTPFDFKKVKNGVITQITMMAEFKLQATAGLGPLIIGGEAMGVDDLDILGNAIFTNFSCNIDAGTKLFSAITFPQLRKLCQIALLRDFGGSFADGGIVPGVATNFQLEIPIPIAMTQRLDFGDTMAQGAARVHDGEMNVNILATAPAGIALANYTVTVSALAIKFFAVGRPGAPGTIGKSYFFEANNWAQDNLERPVGQRIFFGLQGSVAASTLSDTGITLQGQGAKDLIGPLQLAYEYRDRVLERGAGYDITDGVIPLVFMDKHATVDSLPQPDTLVVKAPGVANLNYLDLRLVEASGETVASVSTSVGGGGSVTESVAASRTSAPAAPATAAGIAASPTVITPGGTAPTSAPTKGTVATHASPAAAGASISQRKQTLFQKMYSKK